MIRKALRVPLAVALVVAGAVAVIGAARSVIRPAPAGAAVTPASSGGNYVALPPTRVLDTRFGEGAPKAPVAGGHTLTLVLAGEGGVPSSGVTAVAFTLTATGATAAGAVIAHPDHSAMPATSNLNYGVAQTRANLVTSELGPGGAVELTVSSAGRVQLVADLAGYYLSGAANTPGAFAPVAPVRILDTRSGLGGPKGAVAGGRTLTIPLARRPGAPADGVAAALVNITVTNASAPGVLTSYPSGSPLPRTSTLNYIRGETKANLAVAEAGPDGNTELRITSTGKVAVIVDLFGFYVSGDPAAPHSDGSVTPTRVLDTRTGTGANKQPLGPNQALDVPLAGIGSIPANGVAAVVVNVTVTAATAPGYITAFAGLDAYDQTVNTSNLNYSAGQTIAATVVVPLGSNGEFVLKSSSVGSVEAIVDVEYYLPKPPPTLTWGPATAVDPSKGISRAASCVAPSWCLDVDSHGYAFSYDGTTWMSAAAIPVGAAAVTAVSCLTTTFCVAVTSDGGVTTYNGSTWSALTPIGGPLSSVSCVSTQYCVALSDLGQVLTYNGNDWAVTATLPPPQTGHNQWLSVSCASTTSCVAVDNEGRSANFDGTSWSAPAAVAPNVSLDAVSCPTATLCVAGGNEDSPATAGVVLTELDGQWSTPTQVDSTGRVSSIACSSASHCLAPTPNGSVATFDGATWSAPVTVDPAAISLANLSTAACASTGTCVVVDAIGNAAAAVGSSWSAPVTIDPPQGTPTGLSCTSSTFCVLVDKAGNAITLDAGTWSAPTAIDPLVPIVAVSCTSSQFCVAVGEPLNASPVVSTYDGSTWSSPTSLGSSAAWDVESVSCSSSTACTLVGYENGAGVVSTYGGAGWSTPMTVSGALFTSVSCPPPNGPCIAVGDSRAYVLDGTSNPPSQQVTPYQVTSVSCSSSTFCVAGGSEAAFTYNGSSWSAAAYVGAQAYPAVSCASSDFCLDLTGDAYADEFNGTQWTAGGALPVSFHPYGDVSCPSSSWCLAVDQTGIASIGST